MSKELEALRNFISECENDWKTQPKRLVDGAINSNVSKYMDSLKSILTPPTEEEVCEHLNESFGLKGKNTTLHFIYDKESKEFRMVDEKNYVYRYISTKRVNEDAIELIDLDIDDIIILGRFYESLEGEK